jgi:hypothetical protein
MQEGGPEVKDETRPIWGEFCLVVWCAHAIRSVLARLDRRTVEMSFSRSCFAATTRLSQAMISRFV